MDVLRRQRKKVGNAFPLVLVTSLVQWDSKLDLNLAIFDFIICSCFELIALQSLSNARLSDLLKLR